ncbi:MAG: TetR/AcrR family transcriptional regulator [Actinobacteria bacterium]|nr:TetR/AcrR family transcriptional regulator [Actinomycetota bacterium]
MTDARYERSRAAVFEAVCSVLVAEGFSGMSVDRLAAESGISRSTIYRNWPDMGALACEVFDELLHRDPIPMGSDPSAALHGYIADYARRLNNPTYTAVMVALIEGAARDEAFAEVHRRAFSQTSGRAAAIVRQAQQQGLIDSTRDIQQCVEDLMAPFLYRRLVTQVRITRVQVDDLHTELLERWA